MARLTPLAKGLITLVILGGTAAAAWHLGLRDLVQGKDGGDAAPATPNGTTPATPNASTPSQPGTPATPATPANRPAAGGALGSAGNPVKVSIVSFHESEMRLRVTYW